MTDAGDGNGSDATGGYMLYDICRIVTKTLSTGGQIGSEQTEPYTAVERNDETNLTGQGLFGCCTPLEVSEKTQVEKKSSINNIIIELSICTIMCTSGVSHISTPYWRCRM